MFKTKNPTIQFISTIPGLSEIEEVRPAPYRKFIPEWWKDVPRSDVVSGIGTVRKCPGIVDSFRHGFVLPMWSDTTISYDKESDRWQSFVGAYGDNPKVEAHGNNQFLNHADVQFFNKEASFIFKTNAPWKAITPPGWSVYQMPLLYHFDNSFTTLNGIIDTDIYHDLNPQLVYFGNGKSVTIKRGTPLALYVPFRREVVEYEVRDESPEDFMFLQKVQAHIMTKFRESGFYRSMQKQRDEKKSSGCPFPHGRS